jgi:hypothetical protein
LPREHEGEAVQRQSGFFGSRKSTQPELARPEAPPPSGAPPPVAPSGEPPASAPFPRRRTGSIALVLVGAAAVGVAGGWAMDQWSQPSCDPKLDPQCQQRRSSSSSGSSGGSYGSHYRSWGSWWGGDSGTITTTPATPPRVGQSATQRGGFGAIGRFFSSGS